MNVKLFVVSLANNLFDQINADALHRVTYSTVFIMNMIVANVNAAYEAGVISQESGVGTEVWEELSPKLKNMGFVAVEAGLDPAGAHANKLENTELPWSLSA